MTTYWSDAQERILNQFKNSTHLKNLLRVLFDSLDNIGDIFESLRDERGLTSAAGVWLDNVGAIIGLERPYQEQDYGTIFAFKDAEDDIDDPYKGFLGYGSELVTNGTFDTDLSGWTVDPEVDWWSNQMRFYGGSPP